MQFAAFGRQVLEMREEDGIRSIATDKHRFKNHLATSAIAQKEMSSIQPVDIADLVRALGRKEADDYRGQRKLSRSTVKRIVQLASTVFTVAVERGECAGNPCLSVRKIRQVEAPEDAWTFLTPTEIHRIADCKEILESDRCLMLFAIGTGLRQGEQWNLEMRDLHTGGAKPHVYVRFGSEGKSPKSGKRRKVPLFGVALAAACRWLEIRPQGGVLVFPSSEGRRPSGAPDNLAKWLRAAGIERHVRWHDFRHTCATALIQGYWKHCWNLVDVRDILGHSSVRVTERYLHGDNGLEKAAAMTGDR